MGLDMYLEGEKYLCTDFRNPQNIPLDDRLKRKIIELGYWRKHPDLHSYVVNTFAEGIDNCEPIALEANDIEKIIDAVACDSLPHTEGFFFGASDGSDKDDDLRILRAALKWLCTEEHGVFRSVTYKASW